jgi:glycosyltransferase involved in cell wall biosynthesis
MTNSAIRDRSVLLCTLGYEPGPVGGAERQARLQAEELSRRGWRVEVLTARDPGTTSGRMGSVFIRRLPRLNRRPFRTLTYLPVLFAWLLLNVRKYDIVHVHLANLQADVAAVPCRLFRVPLYVKLAAGGPRGEIARMRPVSWLTRYVGIRWAGRVQATSNEIAADLHAIGIRDERIVRIPNGLAMNGLSPASPEERSRLRRDLALPETDILVLYAGRFAGYKGVLDLVQAWAGLEAPQPARLVLVGGPAIDDPVAVPPTRDMLVISWTDRIGNYFRSCDIYAHPSHADGMPNAVLEAMSCGMAVVATQVAAVPEMISERETGLLVPIGDVEALRAGIAELIADEDLRARLGHAATAAARRTYPITAVVDKIEAAYGAMLQERGR